MIFASYFLFLAGFCLMIFASCWLLLLPASFFMISASYCLLTAGLYWLLPAPYWLMSLAACFVPISTACRLLHPDFLLVLFFAPEDISGMFLCHVPRLALYPRR
jgi:hypothetical protein